MARSRKKTSSVKVNFKGVESRKTPPEGDYVMKVLEAKSDKGPSGDMIAFVCEITKGEYKGVKGYLYCPLAENSLWKLHAFLTALGEEVPEDEMEIDLPELIDKEFVGVMTHEIYNGKKRAKLTDFDSLDNYDGDDDGEDENDDEPKSKKGKKSKGKDAKEKSPDYEDMDEDELRDLYVERKLGTKKEAKKLDEEELIEALEEADAAASKKSSKKGKVKDDEDEDDDEPKSKKGKGKPAKKSKKKTWSTDDVEDMDEDELEELLEEAGLEDEVDLDDYKNLKKKVAAVLEALEEADLLEDDD